MSSCAGKLRYSSKPKARAAKRNSERIFGGTMYVYPCKACRGFHLTRMKRSTFRRMFKQGDDATEETDDDDNTADS